MSVVVLIPAYQPNRRLLETVYDLSRAGRPVIVVDDGSTEEHRPVLQAAAALPNVAVVEHAVTLGKGAALRTGFNHALCRFREAAGIVTADADGQYRASDILRVAAALEHEPHTLVLGARSVRGVVPLRNRIGTGIMRLLFRDVRGQALRDTQTGLRGIPRALAEAMLRADASGRELELDMLISARQLAIPFEQVDIEAVCGDDNGSPQFNPLLDSMRLSFLLLRFSAASLMTAFCDNVVFYLALNTLGAPWAAQIAGRLAAVAVNFNLNRRMVFLSRERRSAVIVRYLAVVAVSGLVSYLSLISLHERFGIPLLSAKIAVECVLFLANFTLLRDFVFASPKGNGSATDWTSYYQDVPWTARLTRRYTTRRLLEALHRTGLGAGAPRPTILELGGGNSFFLDPIAKNVSPSSYHVMDTNLLGLDLLRRRRRGDVSLVLHEKNVMEVVPTELVDVAFSVGLIEHFDPPGTSRCLAAHFKSVRSGGWVLISFPTKTWLYRATRSLLETLQLWQFPDERPLHRGEVLETCAPLGVLVWEKTLWPLCLTQHMMLFQRNAAGEKGGVA